MDSDQYGIGISVETAEISIGIYQSISGKALNMCHVGQYIELSLLNQGTMRRPH
jgi:hypothetical protein